MFRCLLYLSFNVKEKKKTGQVHTCFTLVGLGGSTESIQFQSPTVPPTFQCQPNTSCCRGARQTSSQTVCYVLLFAEALGATS